jgi:hypothetical protein
MTEMSGLATSTTKSKPTTLMAYASFRVMGDRLEPKDITAALDITPTLAYRKGEVFKRARGHEVRGRTGLWLLSSELRIQSNELGDHFGFLQQVLEAEGGKPIERLRTVIQRDGLKTDVTCFWYGERGATPPEILEATRAAFAQIGATIETDFDTD